MNYITGIKLGRQNVFYIIDKYFDQYVDDCIQEIKEDFKRLGIQFGEAVHYDEEFIWIDHQPHVRLTIIDALTRAVIADTVIPRELFNRDYIKFFLQSSLKDLDIEYIVTDGDVRYKRNNYRIRIHTTKMQFSPNEKLNGFIHAKT